MVALLLVAAVTGVGFARVLVSGDTGASSVSRSHIHPADHGVAAIAAITIDDTHPDGGGVTCNGHEVHLSDAAARAMRAQLLLRAADGATEGDPLLPHTPKALAKALTDAAIDLGVRVHGRRVERTRDHTQGALRALGITIADLT